MYSTVCVYEKSYMYSEYAQVHMIWFNKYIYHYLQTQTRDENLR
jgi:hypothetical protein